MAVFGLAIATGGAAAGIWGLERDRRRRKQKPLGQQLAIAPLAPAAEPTSEQAGEQTPAKRQSLLRRIDDDYQQFVQNRIDPLLGKKRHGYIRDLSQDNHHKFVITPAERFANYQLAMGGFSVVAVGVGTLISPMLLGMGIALGFLSEYNVYYFAYLEWKRTRKLGAIHLISIYLPVLWLGGFAHAGALTAIAVGIIRKVMVISESQSNGNLIELFQIQPDTVWVRTAAGDEVTLPFEQLSAGDTLILQAGQTIPVDGVIIEGTALVDQHILTGESQPAEKTIHDSLLATTTILSGKVAVQVQKTGTETTAGQLVEILNDAGNYKLTHQFRVTEQANKLAVPTLMLSLATWPFIGTMGAISLLGANVTTSTIGTNTLAFLNFLNLAADHRILVKSGKGLDELSKVDTIVFDKTGTLTLDQLQVVQIHNLNNLPSHNISDDNVSDDGISDDEILALAAAVERRQRHPIAQAILAAAEMRGVEIPEIDQIHYEVGHGLKVWLEEDTIVVGSQSFMEMESIAIPSAIDELTTQCQAVGHSLIMVAQNGALVGCIELQPTIRPEAQGIVAELQAQNLNIMVISGDQETPTRTLAEHLGIERYFANTLPKHKATIVQQLQEEGHKVCFVGDGINDTLAMRQADVSVSLRGATSAATDTAQIVLMEGNLHRFLSLIQLAQDLKQNLDTNFRFSALISTIAASGVLFAGLTFAAVQTSYIAALLGGVGIAMKPLWDQKKIEG